MATGIKTGGRRKGVPNRVTAARVAEIAASGIAPLDYMLAVLRDPSETAERRAWAAEKAAPYCHPRLATVEHTGKGGDPIQAIVRVIFKPPPNVES